MISHDLLEEFERLSVEERIQLVQDLWDRIAADPSEVPSLTEGQRSELERRLESYSADPSQTVPAGELFARLQERRSDA